MNPSGDRPTREQFIADNILLIASLVWTISLIVWLYQHPASWPRLGDYRNVVIGPIFFIAVLINGSSVSLISNWFNRVVDRGGGLPSVSNVLAVVMTAGVVAASWSPISWLFFSVIGICGLIGFPFCGVIIYRFD